MLTEEISKGTSYCNVHGEVKKLSLVFVVGRAKINKIRDLGVKRQRLMGDGYQKNKYIVVSFNENINKYIVIFILSRFILQTKFRSKTSSVLK